MQTDGQTDRQNHQVCNCSNHPPMLQYEGVTVNNVIIYDTYTSTCTMGQVSNVWFNIITMQTKL